MKNKIKKNIVVDVLLKAQLSQREVVLKELEEAFPEAKEIKDGKKQGLTLDQIIAIW